MRQIPENVLPYKRTPEFNEVTIPDGLLKAHQTMTDVWGKIVILEGKLRYTINQPEKEEIILTQDNYGVIEPTILHQVKPLGKVRFYVEFYR
jgi:tellurite resistance-related uncharacterized protein